VAVGQAKYFGATACADLASPGQYVRPVLESILFLAS
jgi:hypothetical protein